MNVTGVVARKSPLRKRIDFVFLFSWYSELRSSIGLFSPQIHTFVDFSDHFRLRTPRSNFCS